MTGTTDSAPLCGLILVDKQPGITSHFVVARIRKILKLDKVGHLGTLDPFASGLLPIMIGGATRLADEVMEGKKGYLFEISFGSETDTLDIEGQVVRTEAVPENFALQLVDVLNQFTGLISQVPPSFSALKMNGKPLYEHMRGKGELPFDIETKRRTIEIYNLNLLRCESHDDKHTALFRVSCSKGTYIRSLARDISYAIGTVGHCSRLRREIVEPWSVDNAVVFSREIQPSAEDLIKLISTPESMVPHLPMVTLGDAYSKPMSVGNPFVVSHDEWAAAAKNKVTEPLKILLCCGNLLYLTEVSSHTVDLVKVQPRKKIR